MAQMVASSKITASRHNHLSVWAKRPARLPAVQALFTIADRQATERFESYYLRELRRMKQGQSTLRTGTSLT